MNILKGYQDRELVLPGLLCGVEGYFKIDGVKLVNGREERVELMPWRRNLITDMGMDKIGNSNNNTDLHLACHVGSGNDVPNVSNVNLANFVAGTSNRTSDVIDWVRDEANGVRYVRRRCVYRFAQGAAAGNLAEVGISTTAATGNLVSRALIVDALGAPTTLTVTAIDFLDVSYEWRWHVPIANGVALGTVNITGVGNRDITRYNYAVGQTSTAGDQTWMMGARGKLQYGPNANNATLNASSLVAVTETTANPGSNLGSQSNNSMLAYVNGSFSRSNETTLPIAVGNGNIKTVALQGLFASGFQYEFNTPIVKANTQTLTLRMGVTWARVP